MITLTAGGLTVLFGSGCTWQDEHAWSPVQQTVERSLTGSLIVQSAGAASQAGRPVTLQGIESGAGAVSLTDVQTLLGWAAVPGQVMTLAASGQVFEVIYRHHDAPALDARPLNFFDEQQPADLYSVTVKLMCI